MRILFLSQYFPPEMGAPAARTFEHARHWVRLGHEVTVVTAKPNHPTGVVPKAYRGRPLYREEMDGVEVLRCWLFATPNAGVVRRSLSFMSFMLSAMFFSTFRTGRYDVIVATSPQLLCGLAGYLVAAFKRTPFVLEVRDLWPKQIIDLGTVKNPLLIGALHGLEHFLYNRARAIVAVAEASREQIIAGGTPAEKVFTITNGVNESLFAPSDRHGAVRAAQHWGEDTVVMYVGTQGLSQGLTTVLEAAQLLSHREDIRFVFAGSGADHAKLVRRAQAMQLERVSFLPAQTKEDMPALYAAADICLVPLRKLEVFLYNIPSKMFEIMACARPMILGVEGQAKALLEAAGAGVPVPPEDAKALAEAIEALAGDPEARARYGAQGRAHVVDHYSRRKLAEEYVARLGEVLGTGQNAAPDRDPSSD